MHQYLPAMHHDSSQVAAKRIQRHFRLPPFDLRLGGFWRAVPMAKLQILPCFGQILDTPLHEDLLPKLHLSAQQSLESSKKGFFLHCEECHRTSTFAAEVDGLLPTRNLCENALYNLYSIGLCSRLSEYRKNLLNKLKLVVLVWNVLNINNTPNKSTEHILTYPKIANIQCTYILPFAFFVGRTLPSTQAAAPSNNSHTPCEGKRSMVR